MKMKHAFIFILLMIINYGIYAQTTLTMSLDNSLDDARITTIIKDRANPTTGNYICGAWTISGTPAAFRSLFKFSGLSEIPKNAVVQSAYLSLYYVTPNDLYGEQSCLSHSNESVIERITSNWNATAVNWNTQPATTNTGQVTLEESESSTQDYTNINVTKMVQQMVSDNNYGFMLKMKNEDYYASLIFASADNADYSKHPKLVVTYTFPGYEPENSMTIQPNPAINGFFVNTSQNISDGKISIYNEAGRMVFYDDFTGNQKWINNEFEKGKYLVKVYTNDLSITGTVVIE